MKIEFKDGEVIARASSIEDVRILLDLQTEKKESGEHVCTICGFKGASFGGLQIHTARTHKQPVYTSLTNVPINIIK